MRGKGFLGLENALGRLVEPPESITRHPCNKRRTWKVSFSNCLHKGQCIVLAPPDKRTLDHGSPGLNPFIDHRPLATALKPAHEAIPKLMIARDLQVGENHVRGFICLNVAEAIHAPIGIQTPSEDGEPISTDEAREEIFIAPATESQASSGSSIS